MSKTREQSAAASRRYYAKNREAILQKKRAGVLARGKGWRRTHASSKEAVRCYQERNRLALREKQRERQRAKLPTPTRECPPLCECCGNPPNGKGTLHLDHDHATGVFRGWLCASCNLGIGSLSDTLAGVLRAAAYLQRGEQS